MTSAHARKKATQTLANLCGRIFLASWLGLFLFLAITMDFTVAPGVHAQVAQPAQRAMVRGDYLYVVRVRGRCVYMVHFTLSRQTMNARFYKVFGPGRPALGRVRYRDAEATYNYRNNRNVRGCYPDRQHRPWQFELHAFR